MTPRSTILAPGRNCERIAPARRAAWLIDGEGYFAALADALERAERSVFLIGWDFHSQMRLRRGDDEPPLVDFLEGLLRRRRRLHVRMLGWDFAMIYALEREFLPLERFQKRTHRRLHFRLDGRHPAAASHHQKIAVVDDAVAFCGGLDVTVCRWDTREHRADDPRRSDPGFSEYGPFHDVQLAVDGEAARALGAIARERWRRATGAHVRAVEPGSDPWPRGVEPDLRDVAVGIARTQPEHAGAPELRHVEQLYLDGIQQARESIYLENQYFTSSSVIAALAERLEQDDGPEIVIVLPSTLSGWLEERTMGALMAQGVEQLRAADRHGRLRVCVPVLPEGARLTVHSKLMVVDDRLARVGSANLSNRSMGFDSECDLAVESTPEGAASRAIARLRDDLLAEHLGVAADDVAAAIRRCGSLVGAVDELSVGERRLDPFEAKVDEIDAGLLATRGLFDPERPIPFDQLQQQLVEGLGSDEDGSRAASLARMAAAAAVPLGLLALWKLTPLAEMVTPESISSLATALDRGLAGSLVGVGLFTLAALLFVPVVSLIVAAALVFGFVEGTLIALAGSMLSAAAGYGVGRVVWRDAVRRLAGKRIDALNERLSRRGVLATVFVRVVPVAPFAVVNLVAGASRMSLRDFLAGTLVGMAPGSATLAFFGESAAALARDPSGGTGALALLGVVVVVGVALVSRRLAGSAREDGGGSG
ncbi:MAG: VTT domain-containing protein [Myxococcota bacterium]